MSIEGREETIRKIYFDPAGYGSIKNTLKESRLKDRTITIQDVKTFFKTKVEQKTNASGQNSYIAKKPFEEFQVDLFFINDLEDQKIRAGLLMIDIFTKWMVVVPIADRKIPAVTAGMMEAFQKMGGTPEMLYADNETSMASPIMQKYFQDENIKHIATRGKAAVAERSIRTFKDMLYKRIGNDKTKQWTDFIYQILLVYNTKNIHRSIQMTPADARKASNQMDVKMNMELKAKKGRKYEEVKVGDEVKIYHKKTAKTGLKQQVSYWSVEKHKIQSIETSHGQKFYTVSGQRPLLRHEILKVSA